MPFIELQSVDSTNNYARSLVYEGLTQGETAIFAHEQWAGKGQRGRQWLSEKQSNLILSILQNPHPLTISRQFELSVCASVTLHRLFLNYAHGFFIKWPNDLYWQDRKAGGILIENIIRGEGSTAKWDWAIIGIGANINQTIFPAELSNPVSLKQVTGKHYDPVLLGKEYCKAWEKNFDTLVQGGFPSLFEEYLHSLYGKDQTFRFRKNNRTFQAIVKGVSPSGKLVLQHAIEEEYDFGEIEWLPVP